MKKLLAILLALSMLLSVSLVVLANDGVVDFDDVWGTGSEDPGVKNDPIFTLYTGDSSAEYLSGKTIELVIKVRSIVLTKVYYNGLEFTDGLSLVAFDLSYDSSLVTPVVSPVADADSDNCDFTSLLTGTTKEWKGFGKLDTANSQYQLAFYDDSTAAGVFKRTANSVIKNDIIEITIPFTVNGDVSKEDIVFSFANVQGCNSDWTKVCYPGNSSDITVTDSGLRVQPSELVTLPANASVITYAGYKHEANATVILSSSVDTTVGALVTKGDGAALLGEDPDMNYWYVIIADKNGKVTYTNFTLGRPAGAKTSAAVSAGGIVIGVHGTSAANKDYIQTAKVGSMITLYNVNPEGVALLNGNQALTSAGFTIETPAELPADAVKLSYMGYYHGSFNCILAVDGATTIGALTKRGWGESKDMNYFGIIIVNAEGVITYANLTLGRPDGVKTDIAVPAGSYVIGVNGNLAADLAAFKPLAVVGNIVTLYNIKLDTVRKTTGYVLLDDNVGFTIAVPAPADLVLVDGAKASYDSEGKTVVVYANQTSIDDFKAMFENDITVNDKSGNEVTSGIIKTGMVIDFGDGVTVIVLGDIDGNGKVDTTDYIMLKRAVLGTYALNDIQTMAAKVSGGVKVASTDYIMLKRHVLGTYDIYKVK